VRIHLGVDRAPNLAASLPSQHVDLPRAGTWDEANDSLHPLWVDSLCKFGQRYELIVTITECGRPLAAAAAAR
jgi:hypothetical protein